MASKKRKAKTSRRAAARQRLEKALSQSGEQPRSAAWRLALALWEIAGNANQAVRWTAQQLAEHPRMLGRQGKPMSRRGVLRASARLRALGILSQSAVHLKGRGSDHSARLLAWDRIAAIASSNREKTGETNRGDNRGDKSPPLSDSEADAEGPISPIDLVDGKIKVLLRRGSYVEAQQLLRTCVDQLENRQPVSKFAGIAKLQDVPLAITDMDPLCRDMLDEAGYLTIGHIQQADDAELRTIPRISGRRIDKIREAVERTTCEYIEFRIREDG